MQENNTHRYDDIIHLPHHVSETRPHMPLLDRAAQFSPFAAVVGHDAAIAETARLTDEKIILDENRIAVLNDRLQRISDTLASSGNCCASITYFVPDERKAGGSYRSYTGGVREIDPLRRRVKLYDGGQIPIEDIVDITLTDMASPP